MSSPKAGDLVWGLSLGIVVVLLVVPTTREAFVSLTHEHPYGMGFMKFAVLATMGELLRAFDWNGFFRIAILVTIPAFWVPAHTVTFLLLPDFRVLAAAFLSIALGAILSCARRRTQSARPQGSWSQ